jgi:hypothetical protein
MTLSFPVSGTPMTKNLEPYLQDIIDRHLPARQLDGQAARVLKLGSDLMDWAQSFFVELRDVGSHARQTSTPRSSHVKLLLLLANELHRNAGGIRSSYESLYGYLIERYPRVSKQGMALRIRHNGLNIDVFPARLLPGHTDDHVLYRSNDNSLLQTNLVRHVDEAWFQQHEIKAPALYVDFLVPFKLLSDVKPKNDNLHNNFMHMLRKIAQRDFNPLLEDLADPANEENLFSELMAVEDKRRATRIAQQALMARNLAAIIG